MTVYLKETLLKIKTLLKKIVSVIKYNKLQGINNLHLNNPKLKVTRFLSLLSAVKF